MSRIEVGLFFRSVVETRGKSKLHYPYTASHVAVSLISQLDVDVLLYILKTSVFVLVRIYVVHMPAPCICLDVWLCGWVTDQRRNMAEERERLGA